MTDIWGRNEEKKENITIADLARILKERGNTYTDLDPGFSIRGSGTNLDPGFGISMGTSRNLDPGFERRVTNDPNALGSFLRQGGGSLYDNKAIVPIPTTWPKLPEGQLPWKAEPYRPKNWGETRTPRDFMRPLSAARGDSREDVRWDDYERNKKSWWKTSNLQNWRQRNR